MLVVSIPNLDTSAAFVETATKCLAIDLGSSPRPLSSHARAEWALVIVSSVVKVLEETMNIVSAGSRSRTASTRSVPSTLETNRKVIAARVLVLGRLVCHDGARARPADPDIDSFTNAPAGVAAPLAAPNAIREIGHLVQDGMYFGNDVFTIDHYDRVSRGAQRDVEH